MDELRKSIKALAIEEDKTEIEICSMLQAGAAKIGDEESIEILARIKMKIYLESR